MEAAGYRGHGDVFSGGKQSGPTAAEVKELHVKIGRSAQVIPVDRKPAPAKLRGNRLEVETANGMEETSKAVFVHGPS